MATIAQALAVAAQHHRAGRLAPAEHIYRQILAADPQQPEAWHLLGVVAHQTGDQQAAVEHIRRAIALKDSAAAFHNNLGEAYRALRQIPEAVACYRRALELWPDFAEAHNNLGNAFQDQGQLPEALPCYRRAVELKPDYAQGHYNLGGLLRSLGELDQAVACYRRALELQPDYAAAYNNLGIVLREQGQLDEAVACHRRAVELQPRQADAYNNLGLTLRDLGRLDEAAACYRRAVELDPHHAVAHNNFGIAFHDRGNLDEAQACYRRAIQVQPDYAEAHLNLGNSFKDQGQLAEAAACYRRALDLKPSFANAHSNLLYAYIFDPAYDALTLREEHRRWNERHAAPLAQFITPHLNDPSPDRRLRVGYVSANFTNHPVGRFLLPLLEAHDHCGFEIVCYASVRKPDEITRRCRARADVWRDVFALSDQQLADVIRQDQVDILVDLTMHMGDNRLLVFARKPAPVQVTYLAYCGTTGLTAIDYRLTDPYLDPPDEDPSIYSEQSIRLPETYWCYRPVDETAPVTSLPALQAGHVTFASLNNFAKVSPPALAAWSRLLHAVPRSTLLLHARAGSHRGRVQAFFAQRGHSPDRLTFVDPLPPPEYFALYQHIDVALDPFPYGGGTTTCDALWMGVPVVSLRGETAVGRGGLSILSNVGLPELVGHDVDQYVQIAAELAGDLSRLAALRSSLRERMRQSPLTDAPRFARHVENAYRQMWGRRKG